jgi:pimeloyl-ACP methyl ester carboxylesterase
MSNTKLVASKGAHIEVITYGTAAVKGPSSIVALACGGSNVLARLPGPVVEMQMRGYGTSSADAKSNTAKHAGLTDHIGDINSVLDHFRLDRAVLLGYSHGGYFTTAYCTANPERVAGLILVEPALFNSRDELLQRARLAKEASSEEAMKSMLRRVQPSIGMHAEKAADLAKSLLKNVNSAETLADEFLVRADNPIPDEELAALKIPVLVVGGTKSHAAYTVTRVSRILPAASVWWVRGAEHLDLMSEKVSAQLEPVVTSFLAGLGQ